MKNRTLISFLTFFLISPTALLASAIPQDAIMAIVNDVALTYRDLNEYLQTRQVQMQMEGLSDEEIGKEMQLLSKDGIKRLIQDRLLATEADRKEIKIPKEVLDKKIEGIKKKYPDEDVFLAMLQKDGMTISDIRKRIEDQLKIQQLIDQEVKSKIYISPQEISDYYQKNKEKYHSPARMNLDSIFIASGSDPAQARAAIQKALDRIKAGEDFRKVAQECSQSAAVGVIKKGQLINSIEDAVWKLEIGQTSDIVEANNGFYIFHCLGKQPDEYSPLAEVRDHIQQILTTEKFIQSLDAWLDQLEKKAYIEIKDEMPLRK